MMTRVALNLKMTRYVQLCFWSPAQLEVNYSAEVNFLVCTLQLQNTADIK